MGETRSILVVDGSVSMTTMLQRFLHQHHVEVWTAGSVAEAQRLVVQHPFHVVVTDLFLPHQDGLALLRHMRHVAPHTRVVVMTAFGTPELHQHLLAEGAYAFLAKPFRLQQLWHVVQQVWHDASPQPAPPAPPSVPPPDVFHS
jgi:DNA-binding NtrC family response regulator